MQLPPRHRSVWAIALMSLVVWQASATELVYTPTNPTFGGNPGNAAGLLANANAQNNYKAPATSSGTSSGASSAQTALDRFTTQLQSAVLSRLSSTAVNDLFDKDGRILAGKTVTAGNFVISIKQDEQGNLVMTTSDKTIPGSGTTVVVGNVPTAD